MGKSVVRLFFVWTVLVLSLQLTGNGYTPYAPVAEFDQSIFKIDEDQYLGKTVPDIQFKNSLGHTQKLSDLKDKPVLLSLVFYTCAQSCPILNQGLAEGIKGTGLTIGQDFYLLTLSFNNLESAQDAKKFRQSLLDKMKDQLPKGFEQWMFATASERQIQQITDALGYRFFYSKEDATFYHPNVYIFLSPDRKVTRYLFGLYPMTSQLKLALLESAQGKIGKFPILNNALLACFTYDPALGKYKINFPMVFGMLGLTLGALTAGIVVIYLKINKKGSAG